MTELHRIPKKQLDADLVADSDDLSRFDGLDHTTAEVKAAVEAVEELSATPAELDAAAEFIDGLSSTPPQIDAAVESVGKIVDWELLSASTYTATPASTSRITMSDTSRLYIGMPLKYEYDEVAYYGLVSDVSDNAYIDIQGAPLDTGEDITTLYIGSIERAVQVDFFISGTYADGAETELLDADMNTGFTWMMAGARLVAFKVKHKSDDSSSQPYVNMTVNGSLVSTENSGDGPQVSTEWVYASGVAINTGNYVVNRDAVIEISTSAGGAGDAEHLTVEAFFVLADGPAVSGGGEE